MITKDTYFVRYADGKSAWLAPGREIPEGVVETELRVMLFPAEGKMLKHKQTGETNMGVWLKDTNIDDYEECDYTEE